MEKQPHSRLYRGDLEECRLEYSESPSALCRRSSDDPRPFLCRLPNWSLQATMHSSRPLISSFSRRSTRSDIVSVTPGPQPTAWFYLTPGGTATQQFPPRAANGSACACPIFRSEERRVGKECRS